MFVNLRISMFLSLVMSEREPWVKIYIWWDPGETRSTRPKSCPPFEPKGRYINKSHVYTRNPREMLFWRISFHIFGRELITWKMSAELWIKTATEQKTSASQCFRVKELGSCTCSESNTQPSWDSKLIPVWEDACDSSTVTWDRICSQFDAAAHVHRPSSVARSDVAFLWSWLRNKLFLCTFSKSDSSLELFFLKPANDSFQLGLAKTSFLCCFFSLHETVQMKCSIKEWKDLIYRWGCSLRTSHFEKALKHIMLILIHKIKACFIQWPADVLVRISVVNSWVSEDSRLLPKGALLGTNSAALQRTLYLTCFSENVKVANKNRFCLREKGMCHL